MLENLRRKSLVKSYNDPIHEVYFEHGLARYGNHVEIDVCTQRLSKELQESSFKKTIDTLSTDTQVWLRFYMIFCPNGTFTMGHADEANNKPKEETIERPFLLGETEVTQALYEVVMKKNPSTFKHPQKPVENVSWAHAILFCNALSKLQGLEECYSYNENSNKLYDWLCDFDKNGYRLPEEKEWEYAAKAGTQNKWAGTNDANNVELYAICDRNSKIGGKYQTHQVKSKLPNEWGFYDMSGNVSEWCWDKYNSKGDTTADRIYRGGSWMYNALHLRSAHRSFNSPDYHNYNLGFRVCRTIIN